MTKFSIFSLLLFLTTQVCFGQVEELELYKNLYKTSDSLNKLNRPFSIDSTTILEVKKLDKEHPINYLKKSVELFKTNQFNNASFLYYLGIMRYNFYNFINPDNQTSEDSASNALLVSLFGEKIKIQLYLESNIDNFISVLKFTTDYYKQNDYNFYSKEKNVKKYNEVYDHYLGLINDLEINKDMYKKKWDNKRNLMNTFFEKSVDEYNKMTPEEKAKLKQKN